MVAVRDNDKELWGHRPYACCGERYSSGDGEDRKKEGGNIFSMFWLIFCVSLIPW